MKNREQQILSEIKSMVDSIRKQLEELDIKMVEYRQIIDPQEDEMSPIDLDLDEFEPLSVEEEFSAVQQEIPMAPEELEESEELEEQEELEEPEEPVAPVEEQLEEDDDDDDLPFFDLPEPVAPAPVPKVGVRPEPKAAVIDAMAQKQAWRTDRPGTPVKDVRSAISLNDRILFINSLFGEDPMLFVNTLTTINSMTSLDDVVAYVMANFPAWNMESDVVYRFMMAVRRKMN